MKRKIVFTADGSPTLQIEEWQEQYHSIHGAIQEAYHVFIKHGLRLFHNQSISILEIGLGTALNTLITFEEHIKQQLCIHYTGVEAYPVTVQEAQMMNYPQYLNPELSEIYQRIHQSPWAEDISLRKSFTLNKQNMFFQDINYENTFDLIYFDAFGARVQPELWQEHIFKKMYSALKDNGILVTYSAKGSVRRAMLSSGFTVEKLPGPPGKREMLRAKKELQQKRESTCFPHHKP